MSDIILFLDIIPENKRRIEMGLLLRQAWFVNAMLVTMEAWHNMLIKNASVFTKVDHYLMKKIIGSHSKVPRELIYLETAALPI